MKTYKKNIEALRKHCTDALADLIDKSVAPKWFQEIKSFTGENNFVVKRGNEVNAAYAMENPLDDIKNSFDKIDLHKEHVSVLIGFGLGYSAEHLIKNMEEKHHVCVIEPVPYFTKLALQRFDYSEYIEKKKLFICPGIDDVRFVLSLLENELVITNWYLRMENYVKACPEYTEIAIFTPDLISSLRCNTGTVHGAGHKIADNDIECLPYVIRHRGVNELKDLFKGKSAVLVSTGPSLSKNIHILKERQDEVIIIAVGQALRPLLAFGIRPDFICTVDYGDVNMGHFRGIMNSDIPMICINRTYSPLIREYQGWKFIVATPNPGFEDAAVGILKDKGYISMGGSVAHLCLGFAVLLGCDPIILIGQDLAYSEEEKLSHFNQADEAGTLEFKDDQINWKVTDKRSHLHGENTVHSMGKLINVDGYFGEPVKTNVGLASFITSFESIIKNEIGDSKTIINSTQGGAKIKGTIQKVLPEAIDKYSKGKIDKDELIEPFLSYAENANELVNKSIPLLKKDIEILNKIIKTSKKAIDYADKILKAKTEKRMKRFMKLNETTTQATYKASKKLPLIMVAIYGANRTIRLRELNVKGKIPHLLKNREDLKIRVKRSKFILNSAKNAAHQLKKGYAKSLKLLTHFNTTKDEHLLRGDGIEDHSIDDAEALFEAGNFAKPMLEAECLLEHLHVESSALPFDRITKIFFKSNSMMLKALAKSKETDMKSESELIKVNEFIEQAIKAGQARDFKNGLWNCDEALKLMPENEKARWGKATALHHTDRQKEAIAIYESLIKDFPDNPRYKFECGQVCLASLEKEKGLKYITEAMTKTREFDSFFGMLGQICQKTGHLQDAFDSYNAYLEIYPASIEILKKQLEICIIMNNENESNLIKEKISKLS